MNREIKFRAWNKASNYFLDLFPGGWGYYFITFDGKFMVHDNGGFGNPTETKELDNIVIQQYTGLKDRNGKEIYEGDIIKFEKTIVGKSYKAFDYKNPILSEPKTFIWIGEVVFDKINDCDDFYTPTMLAWGVKNKDIISSLCGKIEEHNPNSLYDDSYHKSINQNWSVVGNIFETSQLLEK